MKYLSFLLLVISIILITGCSSSKDNRVSMDELREKAGTNIDTIADSSKWTIDNAIDAWVGQLDGARRAAAEVIAENTKNNIWETVDQAAWTIKDIADTSIEKVSDTINKTNETINKAVDTTKDTANIIADTSKEVVQQGRAVVSGWYAVYNKAALDAALKAGKKVYLFFHATRCPSCKALDSDITSNASSIPSNIIIYKTDYDLNKTLREQYEVVSQHTIVVLNTDGSKQSLHRSINSLDALLKTQ